MTRPYRNSNAAALFLLLPAILGPTLSAQQLPPPQAAPRAKADIRFDFERTGLPVPRFTLDITEDGTGTYSAEEVLPQASQQIHREFTLTASTTRKIFLRTRAVRLSSEVCASKAKNMANTGKKTLTLTSAGTVSSCTYNYSESKDVQALTEIFQGIAETMDQGRRLDYLHRFDRLGLNDAITFLGQAISAGQALEIATIAPTLRSIAEDAEVMQRVRARATTLLAQIPADDSPR